MRTIKKLGYLLLIGILAFFIFSCASTVYERTLIFKRAEGNLNVKEVLTIKDNKFVFTKSSVNGRAVFEGSFGREGNKWIFKVEHFKPANAADRYFNPPIEYVYTVQVAKGNVIFGSPSVKGGRSPLQFIMQGKFTRK